MKIIIAYPPLNNQRGFPTLGQNRQFQFFKEPAYIYPIVPAYAATLLKQQGHEVIWLDCLAEGISSDRFMEIIQKEQPDVIAFETKTPVVKQHWKIINDIKALCTKHYALSTVLFGDHVTALPEESFQNSKVDFVLTGGDYDFLLSNLCNHLDRPSAFSLQPGAQSPEPGASLEPGIYYRDNGQIKNTGQFKLNHDLNSLPFIDRALTKWKLYAYENGNYKKRPGTYVMSGRDCWHGACTFCSWRTLYPEFRARNPENVLDEIEFLVKEYGIREIMDDTGCFPAGNWLRQFCDCIIRRGINKEIYIDCNMRFGALSAEDFSLMKKANFRLLLFGLESANQNTLERINKGLDAQMIIKDCKSARKAGLFPHITVMFGYPWEDYNDALKTLRLAKWLLKKNYAFSAQATVVIPYPGTALFNDCRQEGLLRTLDWDDYDMKQPVMSTRIKDDKIMGLAKEMYKVSFGPEFIGRKFLSLRDLDDLKYYFRALKKVFGHII